MGESEWALPLLSVVIYIHTAGPDPPAWSDYRVPHLLQLLWPVLWPERFRSALSSNTGVFTTPPDMRTPLSPQWKFGLQASGCLSVNAMDFSWFGLVVCFEKGSLMVNTHHIDDDKLDFILKTNVKCMSGWGRMRWNKQHLQQTQTK